MTVIIIYIIGIVDTLLHVLLVGGVLITSFGLVLAIFEFNPAVTLGEIKEDNFSDRCKKFYRYWIFYLAIVWGSFVLIPNSQTIAAMVLLPKIIENEQVQNIFGTNLKVLEQLSKNWLEDLTRQPKKSLMDKMPSNVSPKEVLGEGK